MKIENIIRRVLREEQEEEKLLKIPGIRYFNNDWSILQKFLESQGYPRYSIGGDLDLRDSDIETLGNLVRVEGVLNLSKSDIKTLGNLVRVEGGLNLMRCFNLQSLGNLEYVGGLFYLYGNENLQSLGNLIRVDGSLNLSMSNVESLGKLKYVYDHLDLQHTPLSMKYTREEIKNMVEVGGDIFM